MPTQVLLFSILQDTRCAAVVQEREEAEQLYGAAPKQAPQTFEPDEELKQVGVVLWEESTACGQ